MLPASLQIGEVAFFELGIAKFQVAYSRVSGHGPSRIPASEKLMLLETSVAKVWWHRPCLAFPAQMHPLGTHSAM